MTNDKKTEKYLYAEEQLICAIDLFLQDKFDSCVITLAGAAEEILGKLLPEHHQALREQTRFFQGMHYELWKEEVSEKNIVSLLNRARNEMKHLCDSDPYVLDRQELKGHAIRMLKRAITNYKRVFNSQICYEEQKLNQKISKYYEQKLNRTKIRVC